MSLSCFLAVAKNVISYQFKKRALSTSASAMGSYSVDHGPNVLHYASSSYAYHRISHGYETESEYDSGSDLESDSDSGEPLIRPCRPAMLRGLQKFYGSHGYGGRKQPMIGYYIYDREKDYPDMSFQMKYTQNNSDPYTQIPLAVKKGPPILTKEDLHKPEEEIWIVNKQDNEDIWEPPKTQTDVLDSREQEVVERLIDIACRNTAPVSESKGPLMFSFRSKAEKREFDEIVLSSLFLDLAQDKRHTSWVSRQAYFYEEFIDLLNTSMRLNWPNGDGRNAMSCFLRAAALVCDQHRVALQVDRVIEPISHDIRARTLNYGGASPRNVHNSRYAMKVMKPFVPKKFEDEVEALRNPEVWLETAEEGMDPVKTWYFQNVTPDNVVVVVREDMETLETEIDGTLVVDIKSAKESRLYAENQAFVQALRGLLFRPTSAAVVTSPHTAVFIHIAVENGFINTKKKRYCFRPRLMENSEVDASAYKTLFRDIVLYLWNTHFEIQCRRITH